MNNKLLNRLLERHVGFCAHHGHSIFKGNPELIKNVKKDIKQWKNVALDVDEVDVSKTSDGGSYVIKLKNSKGQYASLWLSSNKVRSITPY